MYQYQDTTCVGFHIQGFKSLMIVAIDCNSPTLIPCKQSHATSWICTVNGSLLALKLASFPYRNYPRLMTKKCVFFGHRWMYTQHGFETPSRHHKSIVGVIFIPKEIFHPQFLGVSSKSLRDKKSQEERIVFFSHLFSNMLLLVEETWDV